MTSTSSSLLAAGIDLERQAQAVKALEVYASAASAATGTETNVRAEALRRAGNLQRRRQEFDAAMQMLQDSARIAEAFGHTSALAQAWNAIALVHIDRGELESAEARLGAALKLAWDDAKLVARIEQNYGVIANIRGDYRQARERYLRSLRWARRSRDDHLQAIVHHNLGMVHVDRQRWPSAARHFARCLLYAERTGDETMRATVLLNRAEVEVATAELATAEGSANQALDIFTRLGHTTGRSAAQRMLGVVEREREAFEKAEFCLRSAIALATSVDATLEEAEARRELAALNVKRGRNADALRLLHEAHLAFNRTGAKGDSHAVASRMSSLEDDFLRVAAKWGRSLESADTYTFGHSRRVATYATIVAHRLNLSHLDVMTVRVGAYLHDIGKVQVPQELLRKPGRLTAEEFEIIKRHPTWGLEMLGTVDFPWRIRPIIRSHHEKADGTGYPDGLRGTDIPLHAQIVCVCDVFDAITSARSYQKPMAAPAAMRRMHECAHWWRPEVFEAFLASKPQLTDIVDGAA